MTTSMFGQYDNLPYITLNAPTYHASMSEMDDFNLLLLRLKPLADRFGAIIIQTPSLYVSPPDTMATATSIIQRVQRLPQPPFAVPVLPTSESRRKLRHRDQHGDSGKINSALLAGKATKVNLNAFVKSAADTDRCLFDAYPVLKEANGQEVQSVIDSFEPAFWETAHYGINGMRFTVSYGSDNADSDIIRQVPTSSASSSSSAVRSIVTDINKGNLLDHIDGRIDGVTHSMYYLGQAFSYFGTHCEDHVLHALSYLHQGAAKVWYIAPVIHREKFEHFVSQHAYEKVFVSSCGGSREILRGRSLLLDPRAFNSTPEIPIYRAVQTPGSFVFATSGSYHWGFNCGYNIAETINYADIAWLQAGRLFITQYTDLLRSARLQLRVKAMAMLGKLKAESDFEDEVEYEDPHEPVKLPWERIVWKGAQQLESKISELLAGFSITTECQVATKEAQQLTSSLRYVLAKWRRSLSKHLRCKDHMVLDEHYGEGPNLGFICDVCGHEPFFILQQCSGCRNRLKTRCMFHMALSRSELCRCEADGAALLLLQKISIGDVVDMEKRLKGFASQMLKDGLSVDWRKWLLLLQGRFVQFGRQVSVRDLVRSQNKRRIPQRDDI